MGKILSILLTGIVFLGLSSSAQADPAYRGPLTTKDSGNNPFVLPLSPQEQVLPKALAQYAPSGSFLERYGFGAAGTPPNPSAVDTVILGLMHASQGETKLSRNIWGLSMLMVTFFCTIAGFVTFKAISAGKETPGLGAVKWVGKTMVAIILVQYVAGAIPRTLISLCDSISESAGEWVSSGDVTETAIQTIADRVASGYRAQYLAYTAEVFRRIRGQWPPESEDLNTMRQAWYNGAMTAMTELENSQKKMREIGAKTDEPADTLSMKISDEAKSGMARAHDAFTKAVQAGLTAVKANSEIQKNILSTPSMDLSGLAYPVKIIRTAIYISVVYIAISIWGMPIAVLMWAAIFSMPTQWGLSNILYSGIKIFFTVLLTMVLVMVYTSATLSAQREKNEKTWTDVFKWSSPAAAVGSLATSIIAGTDTKIGSLVSVLGTSTDLIIASMLILTAPAQAAAIIRGANGAAESAKSAMMAGGAAYGTHQALDGLIPGVKGFQGGSSLGGGTVSLGDFQKNMKPS